MGKKKVILDCDPGTDDAVAIMLAAKHLDVLGITTVGGNSGLDNTTRNALAVLEVIGLVDEIGVYPGKDRPLKGNLQTAEDVHGKTGLGDVELPEPTHSPQPMHGIDFIIKTVMSTDDVTIIATGPLTNVAMAILREPRVAERVREICIMGGSTLIGNVEPVAEFNIHTDPEAAHVVFHSGAHIKMVGFNLTRQCVIDEEAAAALESLGTAAGDLAAKLARFTINNAGGDIADVAVEHDPCTVAWEIDESLIKAVPMHVDVELDGKLTRGMTVCDARHLLGSDPAVDIEREATMEPKGVANAEVALELDQPAFMRLLTSTLASYPKV